jgi:hypothetical protein
MSNKHYVLVPGYVISETDDDEHYITWQMLQRLYQLERGEFSISRGHKRGCTREIFEPPVPPDREIVWLRPSSKGKYGRPE